MTVLHAFILGLVQGITEILPISSSAHLVIIPWLFKWHYQGLAFDISLHFGTALAFTAYFFKDWIDLLKAAFTKTKTDKKSLFWYILIATVPAAVAGLLLEKYAETVFRAPVVMAIGLLVFAVLLWLADHFGKRALPLERIGFSAALTIGLAQILALIPGVSRSGVTITAGLFKGFTREAAARFSFLIATPIMVAAAGLNFLKLRPGDLNMVFFTGVVTSAVSGFVAIRLLLNYVKRSSMNVFVFYRIALAIFILLLILSRTGMRSI